MRILYHHRTLADGAESIHIEEMVSAFRELGHEVDVRGLAASPERSRTRGLMSGVRSVLPGVAYEAASVACNVAEYADVRRQIRRSRPDFLYKRHARYDLGALSAAAASGVPTVLEVNCLYSDAQYHQFEPLALAPLARRMERRALELADAVVAVSTPLARQLEELVPARAIVLPNGANPRRFDAKLAHPDSVRARHGLADQLTIGWTGILRDWHGVELLLDAATAVPGARLLIVGDGPARPEIERRATALAVADRLVITGRVPHDAIPDYLAAMNIAVVADDRTGVASPMKLLEYMSMGIAVVAPRLENIADLVADGVDGLLFAPGDPHDLAKVLNRLAASEELRRALGRQARTTIERERNWRRNAETVLALMRDQRSTTRSRRAVSESLRGRHV